MLYGRQAMLSSEMAVHQRGRLHYLDHMRGILMMLGVVIHSARVFTTTPWLVWDAANTTPVMDYLAAFVHSFRMPAFFVVSGLLFGRSLRSRDVGSVLLARLERIGVPLAASFLLVNTAQLMILRDTSAPLGSYLLASLQSGAWLGHLWFLVYLAGYMVVTAVARKAFVINCPAPLVTIFVAPCAVVFVHAAAKVAPVMAVRFGGLDAIAWLDRLPYFMVGFLLSSHPEALVGFSRWTVKHAVVLVAAFATAIYARGGTVAMRVLELYATEAVSWCLVVACFAVFARFAAAPAPPLRAMADSAYSVYLMHHILVVAVATIMVQTRWHVAAEFLIVCSVSLGGALLIHQLAKRSPVLMYALNGVRQRPAAEERAPQPIAAKHRAAAA